MRLYDKLKPICYRYGVFFDMEAISKNLDHFLLRKVMLKVYAKHNDIDFKEFVENFYANPLDYSYNLYLKDCGDELEVNILNNCFNDKHKKHYGLKYKDHWFFITHSGGDFSLPLSKEICTISDDRPSYIVSYSGVQPNVLDVCRGKIKRFILEDYINKFL